MSDEGGVELVIDELVLEGVDREMVPALLQAIEEARVAHSRGHKAAAQAGSASA